MYIGRFYKGNNAGYYEIHIMFVAEVNVVAEVVAEVWQQKIYSN